jgi:hypothetical protein
VKPGISGWIIHWPFHPLPLEQSFLFAYFAGSFHPGKEFAWYDAGKT